MSERPQVQWVSPARLDYEVERRGSAFVDGDTFIIQRLLSPARPRLIEAEVWVRLLEVNTPERRVETIDAYLEALSFTRDWLESAERNAGVGGWGFVVQGVKKDAFGRLLSYIWRMDTGDSLSESLIAAGHSPRVSALAQLRDAK